jgi:hypothetical protein
LYHGLAAQAARWWLSGNLYGIAKGIGMEDVIPGAGMAVGNFRDQPKVRDLVGVAIQ